MEGAFVATNFITRDFGDAAFAFDPVTRNSLFVEGPLAPMVVLAINSGKCPCQIADSCPYTTSEKHQLTAEWRLLRPRISAFLERQVEDSPISDGPEVKTALQELSAYATRTWQLTTVGLELTSKCNQRCRACYLSDFGDEGLKRSDLRQIARELRTTSALFLSYSPEEKFSPAMMLRR